MNRIVASCLPDERPRARSTTPKSAIRTRAYAKGRNRSRDLPIALSKISEATTMSLVFYMFSALSALGAIAVAAINPILAAPVAVHAVSMFAIAALLDRVATIEQHLEMLVAPKRETASTESVTARLRNAPDHRHAAGVMFDIAQRYHYDQRFAQAIAAYRAVVERYPSSPHAVRAREQLVNLRDVRADDAVTQIG
jgi:hypothetical protein